MNIRQILKEELEKLAKETPEQFYQRFKETSNSPDFLDDHFRNPNFDLRLTHDGGVIQRSYSMGMPNKCETNTFNFIKYMVNNEVHRYYPVSGWAFPFPDSPSFFEHFWVYDEVEDMFLDVTPLNGHIPYAYGGVINRDINDEIKNAEKVFDVQFMKGKSYRSLTYKFMDQESNVKMHTKSQEHPLERLSRIKGYEELNQLVKDWNLQDISDLPKCFKKIEEFQDACRSNREYDYWEKLQKQIRGFLKDDDYRAY